MVDPRRNNPWPPRQYRYLPGLTSEIRPADEDRLNDLAYRLDLIETAANQAYEAGDFDRAADLDAEYEQVAQALETAIAAIEEDEREADHDFEPPLAEVFAGLYAEWLAFQKAKYLSRPWYGRTFESGIAYYLRNAAEGYRGFEGATDEQLVEAARDAFESRRRSRRNPYYSVPPPPGGCYYCWAPPSKEHAWGCPAGVKPAEGTDPGPSAATGGRKEVIVVGSLDASPEFEAVKQYFANQIPTEPVAVILVTARGGPSYVAKLLHKAVETWAGAVPLRAPYHTVSRFALCGPRGELALANGGVLYLENAENFSPARLLEVAFALRHKVTHEYGSPADFRLIAATTPEGLEFVESAFDTAHTPTIRPLIVRLPTVTFDHFGR